MKIVAQCTKCGREFLTVPPTMPAYDAYLPLGLRRKDRERVKECGGEIVLVDPPRELQAAS